MAAILAREPVPPSRRGRDRTVRAGYVEVSEALGNTPAVCKASYVDPRVVDLYHDGVLLDPAGCGDEFPPPPQAERAVLRLLSP
jgi:DNA topoisomerase I